MNQRQSVLIAGTGALACLFAARLAAKDIAVTMLGSWRSGLDQLRTNGVVLVAEDGLEQAYPVHVGEAAEQCPPASLALVLVKSWQTARASQQLAACLAEDGLALTLQNGLGNREILAQTLGNERVALGVTTLGADLLGAGRVRQTGEGTINLGVHPRLGPMEVMLCQAGFAVEVTQNTTSLQWGKLVINAAINPLSALLGMPNGYLVQNASAHELLETVVIETVSVPLALGIDLPYSNPVAMVEDVAWRTATNRSSMLRDLRRGAPTEIDAINGAVVTIAQKAGVVVPLNRSLWLLIKARAIACEKNNLNREAYL